MRNAPRLCVFTVASTCLVACGDSAGGMSDSFSASANSAATDTSVGPGSSSSSSSGAPTSTGTATGGSSSGDVSTGTTDSPTGGGFKLDVGAVPDVGTGECQSMCGVSDFSYIWIANSLESTVSKIITVKPANCGVYGGIQGVA